MNSDRERVDQKAKEGRKKRLLERWHIIFALLMLFDFLAIHFSYFFALWARFDFVYSQIPENYLAVYLRTITAFAAVAVLVNALFRLYKSIWRFASLVELERAIKATAISWVAYVAFTSAFVGKMPIIYYIWGGMLHLIAMVGVRFSYRFVQLMRTRQRQKRAESRVMLIGAGDAGQMILHELQRSDKTKDRVVCIIDDDPNKWGRYINNVPIVGGQVLIPSSVEKYGIDKIYIAIPSITPTQKQALVKACSETGCEVKQLPGVYQMVSGQISVNALKNITIEDLLGRKPVQADMREVYDFVSGKTVLVTGGGGSIGSELCRQVAAHAPRQLILFDIYENSAYDLQLELKKKYPNLNLKVLIGSVRDSRRMYQVFEEYRPDIVYHAAAHKHVPLMEDNPCEAVKNNAIGTYKTAYAAMTHGCKRFVLISTDKAVNPTNIMGASKRLCEMIIQGFDRKIKAGKAAEIPQLFTHADMPKAHVDEALFKDIKTEFVAVRFGNVLGSNGSVIPIFRRQIEAGGPVTVTHPDIIRYFMTIPEAVSLVMLAGTYARGGEIFVLDMGSPVKIDTLARNMIRLAGFKPDEDIRIEYTGLRPGEKLYEEKLMAEEGLSKTANELIFIGNPIEFDVDVFFKELDILLNSAYNNKDDIRQQVMKVVPTYRPEDMEADIPMNGFGEAQRAIA